MRLKKEGDFEKLAVIEERLRNSPKLEKFLMRKLASKEVGILRMIDYYVYYRDIVNKPIPAIENKIRNNYLTLVNSRLQNPEGFSHDEVDFLNTNLQSILKQRMHTPEFQQKLDDLYITALNNEVSGVVMIGGFVANSKNPQVFEALQRARESANPKLQKAADGVLKKMNM